MIHASHGKFRDGKQLENTMIEEIICDLYSGIIRVDEDLDALRGDVADAIDEWSFDRAVEYEAEQEQKASAANKIVAGMSDGERYEILKDRTISVTARVDADKLSEAEAKLDANSERAKELSVGERKKLFKKLGTEFSVFKNYSNSDVKLDFTFSKGNMGESVVKQQDRYGDYAKMLTCFDQVIDSAVGIEVHNRNDEGYKPDKSLANVYVMVSAFEDGERIVPIKLEVKEFTGKKENALYVAVSLQGIKKGEIVNVTNAAYGGQANTSPSLTIRIADLFRKINSSDKEFIKYIPKKFLVPGVAEDKSRIEPNEASDDDAQERASAADDTAINDSSAQHTPEEQRIIEEYKAAVDPVLVKFYKDSKTKSKAKKSFEAHGYQLKNVSDKSARDIRRLTGVNTFGWKTVYDVRQAYHTYVEHGESGRSDHSMSNDEDVGRMQYVLDNYDLAVEFGTTDAYWESKPNGKNRTAKTVAFMKKVDGTYFIVEAVPNTSARTVNIVTAFIVAKDKLPYGNLGKKVAEVLTQPTDATNAPQRYGQTATVRSSSANGSITRGDTDSQVGKSRRSIQTDSEYLSLAAEGFNSEKDDLRYSVGTGTLTDSETENAGYGTKEERKNLYDGISLADDSKAYSYDFMTAQPDMTVAEMPALSAVKEGNKISQGKAVELGLENAAALGRKVSDSVVEVKNDYTNRDIRIGRSALGHSLDGENVSRLRTNARLAAIAGDIVKNAIPINSLINKNPQVSGTYVMATLLQSGDRHVVAIVTVEQYKNSVDNIDYVDVTHAINGRLEKESSRRSSTREIGFLKSTTSAAFISIADFLEIVNTTHRSILSDDVLHHFGETRPEDGHYDGNVKYSIDQAANETISDETKSTEQLRIEELSRLVDDYNKASEAARKTLDEQMKRKNQKTLQCVDCLIIKI